jgi:hypothetical protein
LSSPVDGQVFSANDAVILQWEPVGVLPEGVYYVTTVAYSHLGDTWYDETPWIQATSWTLSEHRYLLDLSDDGEYRWSVQVMRQTGVDDDGRPIGVARSPTSDVRMFFWRPAEERAGTGGGTPGAPPTPGLPQP